MTMRYEPGAALALARSRVVVILPDATSHEILMRLWSRMHDDAGLVEILQELTAAFDSDLRTVPPFVIVEAGGDHTHIAVRGDLTVTTQSADGSAIRVDGRNVTTWSERTADDVARWIAVCGVEVPDGTWIENAESLPLHEAIVLADAVQWHRDGEDLEDAAPVADAVAPSVHSARTPVAKVGAATRAQGSVPGATEAKELPAASKAPAASSAYASVGLRAKRVHEARDGEDAAGPSAVSQEHAAMPDHTETVVVPPPEVDEVPAPAALDPAKDAYPPMAPREHFGDRLGSSQPGEVVREAVVAPAENELWSDALLSAVQPWDEQPLTMEDETVAPWVPSIEATPQDATLAPMGSDDFDHDGHTIYGNALAELRSSMGADAVGLSDPFAATVPQPGPDAFFASPDPYSASGGAAVSEQEFAVAATGYAHPSAMEQRASATDSRSGYVGHPPSAVGAQDHAVGYYGGASAPEERDGTALGLPVSLEILARSCAHGHVNAPTREVCVACSAPLIGDSVPMPRPSLGRIVLSTGEAVELDCSMVVGRRPRAMRADAMPCRLVTVPSPQQDISRSHVEIVLEGWHVLLSDLNTTNGTRLHRSGQAQRRLYPSEPTLMADGDVVDLGDGVTMTFVGLQ